MFAPVRCPIEGRWRLDGGTENEIDRGAREAAVMNRKDGAKGEEKEGIASGARSDPNAPAGAGEDESRLAEDEPIGAWNEDEEEGTIETSEANASEGERGYEAGHRGGASGSPSAEKEARAREPGLPRDDRKR
jgi:hypothetical protein